MPEGSIFEPASPDSGVAAGSVFVDADAGLQECGVGGAGVGILADVDIRGQNELQ